MCLYLHTFTYLSSLIPLWIIQYLLFTAFTPCHVEPGLMPLTYNLIVLIDSDYLDPKPGCVSVLGKKKKKCGQAVH